MAQKRMFSLSVVDTDKFLEMPISSRLLYYELGMRADDDGFVDNWKKIMLFTGLKDDDMKVLISKQFVIPFESGVIVIRHWRLNNYLQNDRTKPTIYQDEMKQLGVDENNVYTLDTSCIHSIEENSIVKNSIDKNRLEKKFKPPTVEQVEEYCKSRNNNINPQKFFDYYNVSNWKDKDGKQVKNWKQKVITWERGKNEEPKKEQPQWFGKEIEQQEISKEEQQELENILKNF